MSWQDRVKGIQVGERVQLSRQWVKENRRTGTDLAKAEGVVTAIEDHDGRRLATIEWDRPEVPDLVNVLNLSRVKPRGLG